jgi:PAS domain S-box-containing protein
VEHFKHFLSLGARDFVDAIPVAIFIKDTQSRFVLMNKACEEVWGIQFAQLEGTTGSGFFPDAQMARFLADDQAVFASGSQLDRIEPFWSAKHQQNRLGHSFKKPLRHADGHAQYLVAVTVDITDQAKAEGKLADLDTRLRGLFDFAPMGIALTNMAGQYLEFNKAFETISGYTSNELLALDYWQLTPPKYKDQEALQLHALQTKGTYGPYEKEYLRKDGSLVPLQLNGALIHDHNGNPLIWSIVEDITERKRSEGIANRALAERDALLKELHHRVKNNLQVIASLLRLESARSASTETQAVLGDMHGRIRSMALVHELLYRSNAYAKVQLDDYLRELSTLVYRTHNSHGDRVRLALELDSVEVTMEQATPCGLIANELISNSLKHGFSDGRSGEIKVTLKTHPLGQPATFCVTDNGIGLADDFSFAGKGSLGLELVSDLALQLDGSLVIGKHPCTSFCVTIGLK